MKFWPGCLLGVLILICCDVGDAQSHATIEHSNGSVTITTSDPTRPLLQALTDVREEYGWTIDLEEPPYQSPQFGGPFWTTYTEPHGIHTSTSSEATVLYKIVSDYNQAGYQAKFAVVSQSDSTYAVVPSSLKDSDGAYRAVTPILDTPISVTYGNRNVGQTIFLITEALTATSGYKVISDIELPNYAEFGKTPVGGENVPARTLLLQMFQGPPVKVVWSLMFDPGLKWYVLNVGRLWR